MSSLVIGIDYSLTSPCMCITDGEGLANAKFYFLTSVKKQEGVFLNGKAIGNAHYTYKTEQERYDKISDYFVGKLPNQESKILIEDYSFGSKGRLFNLAENCGLLKYKLWKVGYTFELVPPTVLKKFASSKGNASKEQMYEAFVSQTGYDLIKNVAPDKKLGNPVTDIVDAYYLAQLGYKKVEV